MSDLALASILTGIILVASTISIELGLASAIIEMIFGVIVGNVFYITTIPDWLTFIASFGSILLTFLAGTEVNMKLMKAKLKESVLIGGLSFLLPFAIVFAFTYYVDRWTLNAAKIAGVALSTTSLAVVYAVLPIFVLGLLMSRFFEENQLYIKKLRTVGYAIITPFFFIKGGMNVGLKEVLSSLHLVGIFLLLKLAAKIIGVYPISRFTMPSGGRIFTTLLMSTGLTFGTLSTVYGFQAGFINKSQFSVLISVVILSAVVPTIIAQRLFSPVSEEDKELLLEEGEEG